MSFCCYFQDLLLAWIQTNRDFLKKFEDLLGLTQGEIGWDDRHLLFESKIMNNNAFPAFI